MLLSIGITSASALNYSGNLGNAASFETIGEARTNGPLVMQEINANSKYISHPVLEGYPEDTTYIYRSANMYGRNGAVRLNTNLVMFSDKSFASKDDALAYLKNLGLVDIIEEATGSIVLVTPANPEAGFGSADQKNYYALQTAMFSINSGRMMNDVRVSYVDPLYYGGYGFFYVIGVDGGATFLNNYVVGTLDYVGRIGGMLLVNGTMEAISKVASYVPVYLVNASADIVAKYGAANGVNAMIGQDGKSVAYNQEFPVRKVVTLETEQADLPALVHDAYYNLFIKAVRGEELKVGLNSASTPYQGYTGDSAPYSLSTRNALINGVTEDGIYEYKHVDERFSDIKTANGEYLQTWYEYLPAEFVNGEVPEGSIPMILALHGGGDDPRQYVDGQGYLELAGAERLAIIAPEKGSLHATDANGNSVLAQVLPKFVKYILETYPQIDASRVYVTGYSMGCIASFDAIFGEPSLFAAAFPQAGIAGVAPTEEQAAKFVNVDVPIAISTSAYDSPKNVDPMNKGIVAEFYNLLSTCKVLNGLDPLPVADYEKHPLSGFDADVFTKETINGEYPKYSWFFLNDDGIPMVGLTYIDNIVHCLYPQYANMVWDFLEHYSRDLNTSTIVYDPYVR